MKEISATDIPERLTILIVDDDAVMRLFLQKVLAVKFETVLAGNGIEAWDILSQRHEEIDVILTDLKMPLLDGMGLLRRVKNTYSNKCVVMLSGSTDISLAVEAIRRGAHDYLSKPFSDPDQLEIIIWRWLQQQSMETKLAQYAALHKEMMRNMRSRTFLALDVVKSRDLKKNEDPFIVQFSFSSYHAWVTEIVVRYDGAIHGTAGDGVMACFVQPTKAIAAARCLLDGLDDFNRSRNQLGNEFALRIGVHTGPVIVDTNGRISEMFSETLDITGHIQKDAKANCITVSEITREHLPPMEDLIVCATDIAGSPVLSYRRRNKKEL